MQRLCDAHDMNNECDGSILTFNLFIVVTFVSSKSYAYIKFVGWLHQIDDYLQYFYLKKH